MAVVQANVGSSATTMIRAMRRLFIGAPILEWAMYEIYVLLLYTKTNKIVMQYLLENAPTIFAASIASNLLG